MSVCTIRSALNQVPFSTQWWGTPPSPPSTVEEYSPLLDISCILQCPAVVTNTSPPLTWAWPPGGGTRTRWPPACARRWSPRTSPCRRWRRSSRLGWGRPRDTGRLPSPAWWGPAWTSAPARSPSWPEMSVSTPSRNFINQIYQSCECQLTSWSWVFLSFKFIKI